MFYLVFFFFFCFHCSVKFPVGCLLWIGNCGSLRYFLELRSKQHTQKRWFPNGNGVFFCVFSNSLYFVGKGVTYDTGGADIKAGGVMRGMSRDKCGAATVAGFMATVAELKPKNVNVTAILSLVRNSVGSNAYVSDEVLYSRNGLRGMFFFVFVLFLKDR